MNYRENKREEKRDDCRSRGREDRVDGPWILDSTLLRVHLVLEL